MQIRPETKHLLERFQVASMSPEDAELMCLAQRGIVGQDLFEAFLSIRRENSEQIAMPLLVLEQYLAAHPNTYRAPFDDYPASH